MRLDLSQTGNRSGFGQLRSCAGEVDDEGNIVGLNCLCHACTEPLMPTLHIIG